MTTVFEEFIRKPFTVEAVEVTTENIEELSELIGTMRHKEDGTPYIAVDRRLVPNVYRVYPGYWVTRMGDNIRCYSKKIFRDQFTESTEDISAWVTYINASPEDRGEIETVDDVSHERPAAQLETTS